MMDRRTLLLSGLTASIVCGAETAGIARAPRAPLQFGLALYTVREEARRDLEGTLHKVAAIGYRSLEIGTLEHIKAADMRRALDNAGLTCTSAIIPGLPMGGENMRENMAKIIDDALTIGIRTLILPSFILPDRYGLPKVHKRDDFVRQYATAARDMTRDDWMATTDFLNRTGAMLKDHGLGIGYHNHNLEFVATGDTRPIDILLHETNPALVTFEMDVGWVCAAGADPFALLRRYPGRFGLMHVKDIKASTLPNCALRQDPTEVGSGIIDWPRLLPAARAAGVERFYVEQEPPYSLPPLAAVAKSLRYIASLQS